MASAATGIHLVLNPDRLSFAEAVRIREKLLDMGIDITGVLINKADDGEWSDRIAHEFDRYAIQRFPLCRGKLEGLESLERFLLENRPRTGEAG
jgi:arsenite-transporting ATPase